MNPHGSKGRHSRFRISTPVTGGTVTVLGVRPEEQRGWSPARRESEEREAEMPIIVAWLSERASVTLAALLTVILLPLAL
jgi:hypothetical protein